MAKKHVYIEVITLEKIPLLVACTGKSTESFERAYYLAKATGKAAWVLMEKFTGGGGLTVWAGGDRG